MVLNWFSRRPSRKDRRREAAVSKKVSAPKLPAMKVERLDERVVPAYNLTIGNFAMSSGVDTTSANIFATANDAQLDIDDLQTLVNTHAAVTISNSNGTGSQIGTIIWQSGADLAYMGAPAHSLSISTSADSQSGAFFSLSSSITADSASGGLTFSVDTKGGNTSVSGGDGSITIAGALSTDTGDVILATNAGVAIDAAVSTEGNVSVTANGAITQTGVISVTGATSISAGAGAITLTSANDFTGAVSATGGPVALTDATGGIVLGTVSATTLDVTANGGGAITQVAGGVTATGLAALVAGGAITLTQSNNNFATLDLTTTSGNAQVADIGGVTLAQSDIGGSVTVTTTGGDLTVSGSSR